MNSISVGRYGRSSRETWEKTCRRGATGDTVRFIPRRDPPKVKVV